MTRHAPPIELDQAALRAVIDAVAMLRAASARLALSALRGAAQGEAPDVAAIAATRGAVSDGMALVAGEGEVEGHAPSNLAWVRAIAAAEPGLLDRCRAFDGHAQALLDAAREGAVPVALAERIVTVAADDFYAATTRLMVLLWTDLETRRSASVATARAAMEAAGAAFAGLSDRASQARILSLNARIEAARADQPAFGVIAREIGLLADDIGTMADALGQSLAGARGRL